MYYDSMNDCCNKTRFVDLAPDVKSFGLSIHTRPYTCEKILTKDHDLLFSVGDGGAFRVNGRNYELYRGFCLLLSPGDVFDFRYSGKNRSFYYYIHFDPVPTKGANGDYFADLPKSFSLGSQTSFFDRECRLMVELFKTKSLWAGLATRGCVTQFIAYLIKFSETRENLVGTQAPWSHLSESLEKSISFIEENFSEKLSLEDMARPMDLSTVYFGRIFKENTGLTPFQYLMKVRIEAARHLLKSTTYSLRDIAESTGFASEHYFSFCFKNSEKMPPGAFRKRGGV